MEHFVGANALLWQKLAVDVQSDTTMEELQKLLKNGGVTFLHINCGQYTTRQCIELLERCKEAIDAYIEQCRPWNVAIGIICELSGPQPRIQFSTGKSKVHLTQLHQKITLTGDTRYENQCFDEVKYVINFEQLSRVVRVGEVLSIDSVKLTVERIVSNFVTCTVTEAGSLKPFSIVERANKNEKMNDDEELDLSSSLAELKRIIEGGCKFVIVPKMKVGTLRKSLESFRSVASERPIQFILRTDDSKPSEDLSELEQSFQAYVTKDVNSIKHLKATGIPILFDLGSEQLPEMMEDADVIITNCVNLPRVRDSLVRVNRQRLESNQQPLRYLSPDDGVLTHCLDFSAKETNASAIILPGGKDNAKLATEICSLGPLACVLIITSCAQEVYRLMLRKYAVPIVEPEVSTTPQQRLIRRAIAYGRRFGYLHSGNCIVSGAELETDGDVVGMEMRYVPKMPESCQLDSSTA